MHPLVEKAKAWRYNTPDHPEYHDLPASTCQYAKAGDQLANAEQGGEIFLTCDS